MIGAVVAVLGKRIAWGAATIALTATLYGWHWWQVSSADAAGYARAVAECAAERDRHNAIVEADRARLKAEADRAASALEVEAARNRTAMEALEAHARDLESRTVRPAVCGNGGGIGARGVRSLDAIR